MPLAITIFGIVSGTAPAIFTYGFFHFVRGPGAYPPPTLPSNAPTDGMRRIPIEGAEGLDLVTWEKIFDDSATEVIQAELDGGRFSIPQECPIEPGSSIGGQPFGPVIIMEGGDIFRATGTGVLYVKGIAVNQGIDRVKRGLDDSVGPVKSRAVLAQLIELISNQSGLGQFFRESRRIGVIDQFYRTQNVMGLHSALFDAALADKPNMRTKEPMRRVRIRRDAAPADQFYRLHITLKNFDSVLKEVLLEMPAGQQEIIVEANSHVTEVVLLAFDQKGEIADQMTGIFLQGFHFGITVQGGVDELPPVFAGAPDSADLESRKRIHPNAFEGPSAGDRAGGLDGLRRNRQRVDALIGPLSWSGESVWFDRGGDGQVEVIRWIKAKIEKPGISKAYLVDPYLGSNALQRVIARQGNENIALTIVVSPGGIDPDADALDTKATDNYLTKLVAAANQWSDRLCGQISIINIQRGEGTKQAFHDRYLFLVDQHGVPSVYLFSNSLSKAAGDWPFVITELDRLRSWEAYQYILALVDGKQGDRDLQPITIWQKESPASAAAPIGQPSPDATEPEWVKVANALLQDLRAVAVLNSGYVKSVGATLDAFIEAWPQGIDTEVLADGLFRALVYREEVVVFVSSRLAAGSSEQRDVAHKLDSKLLDRFLATLPRNGRKAEGHLPLRGGRNEYLQHIGRAISQRPSPTKFVRDKLNPVLHALVQMVEVQRFDFGLSVEALDTGICLVNVVLEVAMVAEGEKQEFRVGMATDYIHWIGRLTRSHIASVRFGAQEALRDILDDDLSFAAQQIVSGRKVLGDKLDEPIGRVLDDALVLGALKSMLAAKRDVE
jgi:hypothetical protein